MLKSYFQILTVCMVLNYPLYSVEVKTNEDIFSNESPSTSFSELEKYIKLNTLNPYTDLESFIQIARQSAELLPDNVLQELLSFKKQTSELGYVYFKGLPQDINLAKTPGTEYPPVKDTFVSEFCLSLFGGTLGEPFNYIQEERGNIYRNVRPTRKNENEQTSDGSKIDLELHTEIAFHPIKPDYLLLYCLRGDRTKQAFTLVSSLTKILLELDSNTIAELKKAQYLTGIDVSFGNKDKSKFIKDPISVLYGNDDDLMITYDLDLMVGLTEESKIALNNLTVAIRKVQEGIRLEPGDLLILDNRRVIHGRTAYTAFYDGYDRWLQRVYITKDEGFSKQIATDGRVVKTEF